MPEYYNGVKVGRFQLLIVKLIRACKGSFSFEDEYCGPYPFSIPGSPGLLTVAQDIIGAINEAWAAGGPTLKTRLTVTGGIPPATNYSTTSSGANYTHSGDATTVGATLAIFLSNHKIRILLNGVEKDKNTEVNWVNATTFSFVGPGQNPGDIITIYN